ncbi:NAD(P)/FAD-dependent oxidoreductase [Amycolatopsis regifaucium]|uniref:FAD-dependent oxidoreductase n=1 Tax=Amycolatopsis regifaucium TaxID=546365 RepID=A0A154M4K2_9PSEU|nr:FAD-binding oxidoreductase [Amycolatopsis regifaucium]KZB79350.1 FAD-dependent oxidoreductase [Amycolatopsis regifaucium]OKA07533.1 FAD-dependent oxidoreductase [Amycolatopsis regifaucium]SFH09035.1 Glycine/D-amino acid oxidase [Amycolatopsis regifaucium]
MRVVLAGGGVIALLTAVECVSAGHEVIVADQADIPFSGATSFDRHRVLRALHPGDLATTTAAVGAHHAWIELEQLLTTAFYEQVGALTALDADKATAARELLTAAGSKAEVYGADELTAAFPHAGFHPGTGAVFESHAGVLLADRVLAACAGWLRRHAHAELHPHRKVVGVEADRAEVRLADGEVIRGDAVLLAAGPWSRDLLAPELSRELVLHRQTMLYCDVPPAEAAAWAATPAITSLGTPGGAWLVPPVAGTPLKLSAASACRIVDEVGGGAAPSWWREHLIDTFAALIPGFRRDWLIDTRDCHYLARRSTLGPMLAVLGDRVLSYAACGGSSFKFAPLIARSLAARLTGAEPAPTGLEPLDRPLVRASGVHPSRPALRGVS